MELYTFDIEAPVTNAKKPFYDKKRNVLYFRSPIKYNYYIECQKFYIRQVIQATLSILPLY